MEKGREGENMVLLMHGSA